MASEPLNEEPKKRGGRPKSTYVTAEVVPLIIQAIAEGKAAGESPAVILAGRLRHLLVMTRRDHYPKVARRVLRQFGITPENFHSVLCALHLPPLEMYRRKKPKTVKPKAAPRSKAPKVIRGRKACRYGAGAWASGG